MRRALPRTFLPAALLLGAGLLVQGCVGMDNFIDNTITTTSNPNRPLGDSLNMRRVQGLSANEEPVVAEGGNVWPRGVAPLPTLQDLENSGTGSGVTPVPPAPRRSSAAPAQEPAPVIAAAPAPAGAAQEAAATEAPLLPDLATQAPAGQRYRTVSTPTGTTVVAPNGDGSSTLMRADGSVTTVPAQR